MVSANCTRLTREFAAFLFLHVLLCISDFICMIAVLFGKIQVNLIFFPAFTIFREYRRHLGKAQTSLAFLSAFTIFAGI